MESETDRWSVHVVEPIDFGWDFLPTVSEAEAKIASAPPPRLQFRPPEQEPVNVAGLRRDLELAKRLAANHHWEGTFRAGCEPRVLWLPWRDAFRYAFVWKQEDDGETFIVTPIPSPWL
jgi:hypothetical protein